MCNPACMEFAISHILRQDVHDKSVLEVGSCNVNGFALYSMSEQQRSLRASLLEARFRYTVSIGKIGRLSVTQATLAQLVERLIRNQQVAGSIPAGGSSSYGTSKFDLTIRRWQASQL